MASLEDILYKLGTLEGKMDTIHDQLPELNKRVRALEQWRSRVLGIAAAAGVGAGLAKDWFMDILSSGGPS